MPLDAICLGAVTRELNDRLIGAKIDKISQPERDEFIISLRSRDGNVKLLITTSPNHARIHMISAGKENPTAPPMFCMLMRKHLLGSRITSVEQPGLERMLTIKLTGFDEFGEACELQLVCELMGRYSNIILVGSDGRIIDCLKRVDGEMSEKRQVLPGMFYHLPPQQDKRDLSLMSADDIVSLINVAQDGQRVDKWILDTFFGVSPLVCREIAYSCIGESDARFSQLSEYQREKLSFQLNQLASRFRNPNERFTPYILCDTKTGAPVDFSFMPLSQYGVLYSGHSCATFSELLDEFYSKKDSVERIAQRSQEMLRAIINGRDRLERKLAHQRQELAETASREQIREKADILGAFSHKISRGATSVSLQNLYGNEGDFVEITLDERLSPQQNIQRYYKNYNRMKTAEAILTGQISVGENELEYLDTVFDELARAESPKDLDEIREELAETGYLSARKLRQTGKSTKKSSKSILKLRPMVFESPNGFAILVGRNNRQNDALTLHEAGKSDIWFHTQKIPGSHVILCAEGASPENDDMTCAAELAAYYSKARESALVPVDFTPVKYIKKPPAAKPGMVTYDRYQTAYVLPRLPINAPGK